MYAQFLFLLGGERKQLAASIYHVVSLYSTSCFLDLKTIGSADEPDMAVWLSEDRAARWRAALLIVSKKLSPSPSAILYLHGVMAGQMLDTGFSEVFVTRDSFSDMLVLSILCLERGGVDFSCGGKALVVVLVNSLWNLQVYEAQSL